MTNQVIWKKKNLIAHRGASAVTPENTLPALQMACEMGATWVEFDVVLSADGQPFVFHDATLTRTTNGQGLFADKMSTELKQLDAGQWFSSQYKNTVIPSLTEWLNLAADLGFHLNLEIKPLDNRIEQLVEVILKTVNTHWSQQYLQLLISSFSIEALRYVRACDAKIFLGLLLDKWQANWEVLADELACATIHLNWRCVTKAKVDAIHATGRLVACYTVNDAALAQRLFDYGVDAIFSNYVDLLES